MTEVLCVGGSEHLHSRHLVLQSAGFEVTVATNERAALASVSSTVPRAVILDSSTVSPIQVATQLKRVRSVIPILLITDGEVNRPLEPPFDRIISRLDGPEFLLDTLLELTSSHNNERCQKVNLVYRPDHVAAQPVLGHDALMSRSQAS